MHIKLIKNVAVHKPEYVDTPKNFWWVLIMDGDCGIIVQQSSHLCWDAPFKGIGINCSENA